LNYYQAQNLLDEIREGAQYSLATINKALELTGDIDGHGTFQKLRGSGMDSAVSHKAVGIWQRGSFDMVAGNTGRHSQKERPISGGRTAATYEQAIK
jgi:hypothetical protein